MTSLYEITKYIPNNHFTVHQQSGNVSEGPTIDMILCSDCADKLNVIEDLGQADEDCENCESAPENITNSKILCSDCADEIQIGDSDTEVHILEKSKEKCSSCSS